MLSPDTAISDQHVFPLLAHPLRILQVGNCDCKSCHSLRRFDELYPNCESKLDEFKRRTFMFNDKDVSESTSKPPNPPPPLPSHRRRHALDPALANHSPAKLTMMHPLPILSHTHC